MRQWLRSHRAYAKRCMRIKKRPAVALALATAGALAVAGIALASQTSTVTFKFTPSNVPPVTFQAGGINLHTHTTYSPPLTAVSRIEVNLDNDFRIDPSVTPKCDPAQIGNVDMATAMSKCGPGSGNNAWLWPDPTTSNGTAQAIFRFDFGAYTANGCVLLFNATNDAAGRPRILAFVRFLVRGNISCANPGANHQGQVSANLVGVIRTSPLGGDYLKQLYVPGISKLDLLVDFNATIKRGKYISARCHDANHQWNLQTKFTYSDGSTQTVNSAQTCS